MAITGLQSYIMSRNNTSDKVASALVGVASMTADNDTGTLIITMTDGSTVSLTPPSTEGRSLEYNWDGTKLGVRVEGSSEYSYVDLKGETGSIDNADLIIDGENIYITSDGVKQGSGVDLNADVLVGLSEDSEHLLEYEGKRVDMAGSDVADADDVDQLFNY